MNTFFRTERGWINSAHVVRLDERGDHSHFLTLSDGTYADLLTDPDDQIVQIVPANGDWELLVPYTDDDAGELSYIAEPVIAWGLMLTGTVTPITPLARTAVERAYAGLRKAGSPEVLTPFGSYSDSAEWLSSMGEK